MSKLCIPGYHQVCVCPLKKLKNLNMTNTDSQYRHISIFTFIIKHIIVCFYCLYVLRCRKKNLKNKILSRIAYSVYFML